ncbi:endonuclease domain-containing protein [Leucobacter allii]|uniref:endonuclease domain-containing protein n=1 Tax=Leucobacter allii TaxID=2932247 RepID=UPI001FD252FE|nr:endonuclease domain-containing protein [Leucobacter allii]UOR03227.1 endonuclease domain-containing protein [Leucobacter allii]
MTRPAPLPERLPRRSVPTGVLLALGVRRSRLRAEDLRRTARGVVLLPGTPDGRFIHGERGAVREDGAHRERCLDLAGVLRDQQFFTRRSAAALWGLPVPAPPGGAVEIAAFHPRRAPRRPEVIAQRLRAGVLVRSELYGLALPSPADTWCLLGAVLDLEDLVVAGDAALTGRRRRHGGRQRPLTTRAQLAEAVRRHHGGTGIARCREALPLLRDPVDSPQETRLRRLIVRAGLPEPVVDCAVPVEARVLHADLGYPELRIAIEYEGAYHFEDGPARARRDADRWEAMSDAGWRVIRVQANELLLSGSLLARIARARTRASR